MTGIHAQKNTDASEVQELLIQGFAQTIFTWEWDFKTKILKNFRQTNKQPLPFSINFAQVVFPLKIFPKIHPLTGNEGNSGEDLGFGG